MGEIRFSGNFKPEYIIELAKDCMGRGYSMKANQAHKQYNAYGAYYVVSLYKNVSSNDENITNGETLYTINEAKGGSADE